MDNLAATNTVAPAKAGAHDVSLRKPTGEIGTSLRWCDVRCFDEFGGLN